MLLSFLKFPFPVLRHRIFSRISTRFSFVYARQLVEEGVRQNPVFVQNGENVAKTGQIGDIVSPFADLCCKIGLQNLVYASVGEGKMRQGGEAQKLCKNQT